MVYVLIIAFLLIYIAEKWFTSRQLTIWRTLAERQNEQLTNLFKDSNTNVAGLISSHGDTLTKTLSAVLTPYPTAPYPAGLPNLAPMAPWYADESNIDDSDPTDMFLPNYETLHKDAVMTNDEDWTGLNLPNPIKEGSDG
jgi:hypothetical protein